VFNSIKPIEAFELSFQGRRQTNQDSCLIYNSGDLKFYAIADGMGGMAAGAIASQKVLETAKEILTTSEDTTKSDLKSLLKRIFTGADNAIRKITSINPEYMGMGTTLTCLLAKGNAYVYGNIGDSRLYFYNGSTVTQLTEDHTYVEKYIRQFGHPVPLDVLNMKHVIYKAINGEHDDPDIFPLNEPYSTFSDGDTFLICSDGMLTETEEDQKFLIKRFLTGLPTLQQAAEQLICEAYHNGSTDNISVLLLTYGNLERISADIEIDEYPPLDFDQIID
jgi:serine/threonine protein phosphatase PrpC